MKSESADLIIVNGNVATMDNKGSFFSAFAIKDGYFIAIGTDKEILEHKDGKTKVIDVGGRTVIPGLDDSHIHLIRGGLNYNMELRWDGVTSLTAALNMLQNQAKQTPTPHWVRVVGGWSEFQFSEKRLPTLSEINNATGNTPAFILYLYQLAMLNKPAIKAVGLTNETPNMPGSEIDHDEKGSPTGLLVAKPNPLILYSTLAKGPKLSYDEQINSTRQFMYELNRFGITSVIDAGGGFQNYPDDYKIISELAKQKLLTTRIAYNLFTQRPGKELDDFSNWIKMTKPGDGDGFLRMNGAGEMLVFSASDFEDWAESRPDLAKSMETELGQVVKLLVQNRWPFRLHATYNESIKRFLDVFEDVNSEIPFNGLRWFFDHAETISEESIKRVKKLGGGIAVQDRMAFQGEYFVERYGAKTAEDAPPISKMLEIGIPVGMGTDATRVSSYNPWVALYWIVSGRTVGGMTLHPKEKRLDRMKALELYTVGSAWFSSEEGKKGSIEAGKYADFAVLSDNYFTIPEEKIKSIESLLTVVDGKIVYAASEFKSLSPPHTPIIPAWSPVLHHGGYSNTLTAPIISYLKKTSQRIDSHQMAWGSCCHCAF